MSGMVWGYQSVAGVLSWKRTALQRKLEPRSRGIAIVKAVTRKRKVETVTENTSLCALFICKVWRSAMAL
jgi:hypothetical protein